MSHEITVREDGFAEAAFSLQPAWHGLGTVFDHAMDSKEALSAAGLDWRVVSRPMAVGKPGVIDTPDGEIEKIVFNEVPNLLANVREDNDEFLGVVTDRYQIVNNTEAFEFLDALVENHDMRYESAFSLSGGKKVVLLGQLPKVDEIAEGDSSLRYVLMSLSHDGTGAIRFGPTAVRVVCANTYALAVKDKTGVKELSIRHTGNIGEKLNQARKILGIAREQFEEHSERSRQLVKYRLSADEWSEYLDLMCPSLDARDPDYTERRAKKIADTRAAIRSNYRNERQTVDGIGESAWAAYNAVSEHIDHLPRRGATQERKAEARFNVTLYGPGRDMKQRAFEAACRFANLAA
jgi:phage/plasmid-like protein (TIGR03299 family)